MTNKTHQQMREVAARLRDPARVVTDPSLLYEDDDRPGEMARYDGHEDEDEPDRACIIGHCALVTSGWDLVHLKQAVRDVLPVDGGLTSALEDLGPEECARRIEAVIP